MSNPLPTLLKALRARLAPNALWASRAYLGIAPAQVQMPFVVYDVLEAIEENRINPPDPLIVVQVKCLSDQASVALDCAAQIVTLLNDQGAQDVGNGVPGDTAWQISTITLEEHVLMLEQFANAADIWHAGAIFRVRMYRK